MTAYNTMKFKARLSYPTSRDLCKKGDQVSTSLSSNPNARAVAVTIVMPCLNEAETLAICIRKALAAIAASGLSGEVVIADNGSTDGSLEIAAAEGARVIHVPVRGYGAALIAGIEGARGNYVLMADADDSYEFGHLPRFVAALDAGSDLVVGNRFRGEIKPGAMPPLASVSWESCPERSRQNILQHPRW